jgi:hypothetical protein
MNTNRRKLRLRKQVLISIPLAILIAVASVVYILSQNTALAQEVTNDFELMTSTEVEAPNKSEEELERGVLSNNSYIEELNQRLEIAKKDNVVRQYAQAYSLNQEKVLEIVHYYTNNYSDPNYLQSNIISTPSYYPNTGWIGSWEAGIVFFIKDIYTYPERYGSSIPEMRLTDVPRTSRRYDEAGNIIMDNGMTYAQYLGHIADLFGVDKATALAISYHETGVMTSNLFRNKNNIGGHKGLNGWKSFLTLEAGVIGHVLAVRNIAAKAGVTDMTTYAGLSAFSSVYVNGHVNNPSESWTNKVTYFRNQINSQDLFTIK